MQSTEFCPECARPTDRSSSDRRTECPHCGTPLARDVAPRWINVARVTNLAEAGFLVDELSAEGINARIYQTEDFSALSDRWIVSYMIQSPPPDALAAAGRIRQHLAEIDSYQDPATNWSEERPALDPLAWRPVALVLLAGMASFVLGQRFAADRAPPRQEPNSLTTALTAIGRPLATEPAAGQPRHRLYYHRRDHSWHLDTDTDGDGRYDIQQRFHTSGAGW